MGKSAFVLIREHVERLDAGELFSSRDVLQYGSRSAVDVALFKLVSVGTIKRYAWGVFARFEPDMVEPTLEDVVHCKLRALNRKVVEADSLTAQKYGLTISGGTPDVYYTDGASSSFKAMGILVTLRKRVARKLLLSETSARQAVKALWVLKKENLTVENFVSTVKFIGVQSLPEFRNQVRWMPAWMSDMTYRLQL